MRQFLVPITLLLAACAQPSISRAAAPSVTYPFRAVGRTVAGVVAEDLLGEARVFDNEVHIVVQRGVADFQATPTRRPIGLSAGLAYRDARGWHFRKESEAIPIEVLRTRGDSLVAPVEFRLRDTRGLDLAAHWIVIQQHRYILFPQDNRWHEATRPIDSDSGVFKTGPR